jgi:hypothetical protein
MIGAGGGFVTTGVTVGTFFPDEDRFPVEDAFANGLSPWEKSTHSSSLLTSAFISSPIGGRRSLSKSQRLASSKLVMAMQMVGMVQERLYFHSTFFDSFCTQSE